MRIQSMSMGKDKFITTAKLWHGDTYDYSLVEYINCDTPVDIVCPTHGLFKQRPYLHSRGAICRKCADVQNGKNNTKNDFIDRVIKLYNNKYNYDKTIYRGAREKLIVTCKEHGDFQVTATNHLRGRGCKECHYNKLRVIFNLTTQEFIERADLVHDCYYSYSKVVYEHNHKKVTITCPIHGDFAQLPGNHFAGKGCKKCKSSSGENKIRQLLCGLTIDFVEQQIFHDCRNIRLLPFDFYLPDKNVCIEYDGEQHYKPIEFFGGQERFEERQKIDIIKTNYCKINSIGLIRISYKEKVTKEFILSQLNNYI